MANTILVLGATGGIGGEVAKAFLRRGWHVRALTRRPEAAQGSGRLAGIEWLAGDAMQPADLQRAAAGARILFHGAHPARYAHWDDWGITMFANSIAAAKAAGARLILPGTIYNYGPDAGTFVAETAPQNPLTAKGRTRVRMEHLLQEAAGQGLRSLVVRAADFIGPHAPSSWFGTVMVKPGKPLRAITYPGRRDVGHAFAYLPDLAETIARLVDNEEKLAPAESVHFAGHWFETGDAFGAAIASAANIAELPIRRFPWPAIWALQPIWPLARGVWEMRHLWREPLRLDNRKLVVLIGPEPHTPTEEAMRQTLLGLNCLPRDPVARRASVATIAST